MRIVRFAIAPILAVSLALSGYSLATVDEAFADETPFVDVAVGSATVTIDAPLDAGAGSAEPSITAAVAEAKDAYDKLRAAPDDVSTAPLWAALIAALLKVAVSILYAIRKTRPKQWLSWALLGLAVPIALLSYYALGNSWLAAVIHAGGGPGAVLVHELIKAITKPAESTAGSKA